MGDTWSMLLSALAGLVCMTLVLLCVPLLKARLGEDRFRALQRWITIGVEAAEQLFGNSEGARKKDWVLSLLLDRGQVKSADEVTALLESEVFRLQNR